MSPEDRYWQRMRRLSLLLFPLDVGLGIGLVVCARLAEDFLRMGRTDEPAFIRISGLFTVLLGYLYYRVYRDPRGGLALFQVTTVARLLLAILHFCEARFLIPGPHAVPHYLFYAMSAGDLGIFGLQVCVLGKLGRKWLVV